MSSAPVRTRPGLPARLAATARPTDESHTVTTLELFFDLVFVFAITQVTAFLAVDPSLRSVLRGLVLLALMWWAWCSYAWLTNQAKADEGVVRAALLLAMAALFVVALALPEAWGDRDGGVSAPLLVAACLAVVRLGHLGVYAVAAAGDRQLLRTLGLTAVPVTAAAALLVAGALAGGPAQTALWALALVVDYAGIYLAGSDGWQLRAPGHFAERHGLIVIVALGESVIAIGVGVADLPVTWPVVAAAMLGLAVTVALWWTYFDVVALVAERVLAGRTGRDRTRMARDSYTYLHFPMIAGIVFLALGLKKVMTYVADTEHHALGDALTGVPLHALFWGPAAYLLAHVAFRRRNVGSWNVQRIVAAGLLVVLAPVGTHLPALASLAVVAGVLVVLVAVEATVFRAGRRAVRDEHGPHVPAQPTGDRPA